MSPFFLMKYSVRGAGIAGLTAAINLCQAGHQVHVFERADTCGKAVEDFQYLENWTAEKDVLERMKDAGIHIDFPYTPVEEIEFLSGSHKAVMPTSRPIMYMVKRGPDRVSFDTHLYKQAIAAGVKVHFNAECKNPDIIATGPASPTALATGIMFETDHRDIISVLFDRKCAPAAYSYCVVHEGIGQITACAEVGDADMQEILLSTIKRYKDVYGIKIKNSRATGGAATFLKDPVYVQDGALCVGEAAGLQDPSAGFGMMYAVKSGQLAAEHIGDTQGYAQACQEWFSDSMQVGMRNRSFMRHATQGELDIMVMILKHSRGMLGVLTRSRTVNELAGYLYRSGHHPVIRLLCRLLSKR